MRLPLQFEGIPRALVSDPDRPKGWFPEAHRSFYGSVPSGEDLLTGQQSEIFALGRDRPEHKPGGYGSSGEGGFLMALHTTLHSLL